MAVDAAGVLRDWFWVVGEAAQSSTCDRGGSLLYSASLN